MAINNPVKPRTNLCRRKVNKKIKLSIDIPPLLHRLYTSRGIQSANDIDRNLKSIISWRQFSGIEKAVNMLYKALRKKIRIIVVGDFDADGATGTALIILSLRALGCNNIDYLALNRFKDGYGLNPRIVEQAYVDGARMIITVDNGISSYTGIDHANHLGIPVLVTDHHLPGCILPDAEAIVNPNLHNCDFPSKSLSGVGVVFYLMLALRTFLRDEGWFEKLGITIPNMAKYLDLVALGTVADVVPLDVNNRILVWQGLKCIRSGQCRPGIKALVEVANCNLQKIVASDLGFLLGPRLNAAGRLDDISIGISLLLCENYNEAQAIAYKLNILNQTRKKIEHGMQADAITLCETMKRNREKLPIGLVIYHPNWHQGVIGILASRIKEELYRPVIIFASANNGMLKGSGRSIQGLNILNALKYLDTLYPDLILKFGGHSMAAGLLIEEKHLHEFQYHFDNLMIELVDPSMLQGKIISDGPLMPTEMTVEIAQMLRDAGPWGHMFPEPIFDGRFRLLQQQLFKERHMKVIVKPIDSGPLLYGVMFNVNTTYWPDKYVREVELVYKLDINEFNNSQSLQIIIDKIWPI